MSETQAAYKTLLSSRELAKKTGLSLSYINMILSRTRRPSPEIALILEQQTDVKREAWIWPDDYSNPYIKN